MSAPDTARLTVNLDAIAANLALIREHAPGAEVAPAVKADAYGLGADAVARRLRAEGASAFFVARVGEGERLRAALGPEPTIWVLDGCPPGQAARLEAADLRPVLNSVAQLETWRARATGRRLRCALHVDTGMNRLGLRPEQAETLATAPDRLSGLDVELLISHLACADAPDRPENARQLASFNGVIGLFPDARRSLSASAGVFLGRAYRFDQVRPGITLYGGGPRCTPDPRVRPVATLEAEILQVRSVPPGETVGYGGTWRAERPTRVAILGVGYADGVPRSNQPRGAVALNGRRLPMIGRVSMDLIAVDLEDAPAAPGDTVELFGPSLPIDEAAANAGTLAYELLTRVAPRVENRYLG
jgi:alanine racemase